MNTILKKSILTVVLILLSVSVFAQIPKRPSPPTAVNDFAEIFTKSQKMELENALVEFSAKTSNAIVIISVKDLEGISPSEYAYSIGEEWELGSSEFNNGIVILIKPKTENSRGEAYIAVGYGLEPVIPDAIAIDIVSLEMIPHFRNNDYFAGVVSALNVIMPLAAEEITHEELLKKGKGRAGRIGGIVILLIIVILLSLFSGKGGSNMGSGRKGSGLLNALFLASMLSGGGRGSGGGFGGGGSSGGFGGFGGGSFGGGGAGGSW